MTSEVITRLGASVQPLIFETGVLEFPYSTGGTVFFVGYAGRAFVLTARHALFPENISPICVFPSDTSQRILPLKNVFFVSREDVPDDFVDLAVIEIDMNGITDPEIGSARIIDLSLSTGDWLSNSETAEMFVLGYPEEHSFVDYELETLTNHRWALHGRYAGLSELPYLHVLEVHDTHSLSTFSGFSGGPVFALIEHPKSQREIILCGMALRGTPTSRRIHFLDRSVLLDALNIVQHNIK